MVRFSADEHVVGGPPGPVRSADDREAHVRVGFDAFNAPTGSTAPIIWQVAPMYMPHAWTVHNAAEVKKRVKIRSSASTVSPIFDGRQPPFHGHVRSGRHVEASLADPHCPISEGPGLGGFRSCIGCCRAASGAVFRDPFRCSSTRNGERVQVHL
jgi:hypothetical protein